MARPQRRASRATAAHRRNSVGTSPARAQPRPAMYRIASAASPTHSVATEFFLSAHIIFMSNLYETGSLSHTYIHTYTHALSYAEASRIFFPDAHVLPKIFSYE
jgi:hypothetical protein